MRLFIALPVPADVRENIILHTAQLRGKFPGLKWVGQDALHLTLSFLGETDPSKLETIRAAMNSTASQIESYDMELVGMGAFPRKGPPRVLFIPVKKGLEETRRLNSILVRELGDLSPKEKRKFTPHLTIARVKNTVQTPDPDSEGQDLAFTFSADRLILYRSHLTPDGARYEELEEARFGRAHVGRSREK